MSFLNQNRKEKKKSIVTFINSIKKKAGGGGENFKHFLQMKRSQSARPASKKRNGKY